MTIEFLRSELKRIIIALTASGFDRVNSGTVEKLDKIAAVAEMIGMKEGKRLIGNLSNTMKAIQERKSGVASGIVRLMALDFYVEKLAGDEDMEEL